MALADRYFKEEVNKLLTEGFNDKDYEVRPKWINEDGSIDYEKSNLEWCDAKYNMNYGTINRRRGESLGYGKDNPYSIPIIQYDKNGEFIKEWDSTMDVERELHIQHSNITKCCKKQLHFKTAGGFIWRYKEKAV